jgi:putative transcriptional regulator
MLLAYGAGSLDQASALIVASHIAMCPRCHSDVVHIERVGGMVLETSAPAELRKDALQRALDCLDTSQPHQPAPPLKNTPSPWPAPLRPHLQGQPDTLPWKRLAKGIEQIVLVRDHTTTARLLRIAPATRIPQHGHHGNEMTLVLQGGFHDLGHDYLPGDLAVADQSFIHAPESENDRPCICLAVTDAPLRLLGFWGRLAGKFIDI